MTTSEGQGIQKELRAFLQFSGTIKVISAIGFWYEGAPSLNKWQSFKPIDNMPDINLIMVNDDLWALRITTDYKIIYEFQAHYVRDFECDGEIMVYIDDPYVGVKVVAYNWDIDSQSFTNHIIGYDFDLIEQNAKRLLYTEQDFSATITFLAQFLSDPALVSRMPPSCASSSCEFIVDWYIPHLRYLLGIAYEMNNQPEQAKQVYYNLWKDYPANIFGLAAAAKLEPIQP